MFQGVQGPSKPNVGVIYIPINRYVEIFCNSDYFIISYFVTEFFILNLDYLIIFFLTDNCHTGPTRLSKYVPMSFLKIPRIFWIF